MLMHPEKGVPSTVVWTIQAIYFMYFIILWFYVLLYLKYCNIVHCAACLEKLVKLQKKIISYQCVCKCIAYCAFYSKIFNHMNIVLPGLWVHCHWFCHKWCSIWWSWWNTESHAAYSRETGTQWCMLSYLSYVQSETVSESLCSRSSFFGCNFLFLNCSRFVGRN